MRLPRELFSALGPVPVTRVPTIPHENPEATTLGRFQAMPRSIELSDEVGSDACRAATLCHEWVHVALFDSGISNLLTREQEESICDAIATVLAGAMLNGYMVLKNGK